MKIKINYFTSTGNTLWLVNKMKTVLESFGHKVIVYDSVIADSKCLEDCDMIGFVYPVWGSTMPNPQRKLVAKMKKGNGKQVFFIGNAGIFCGDTGIYYKHIVDKKGYKTIYVDHVFLPLNSVFPGFLFFKQQKGKKKKVMLMKAEKKIQKICNDIHSGRVKFKGRGPLAVIGGKGQRNHYDLIVDKFKEQMYIDQDRCRGCGLCFRICPENAIHRSDTGKYMIENNKCIFCLKCYNMCPQVCAMIGKESLDTEKYTRYKGMNHLFKPISYR